MCQVVLFIFISAKVFSIICLLIRIYLLFNFIFLIWFYKHKLVLHKNTPSAVLSGKESIIVTSIFIMSKLFMRNYLCYKKMLEQKIKTLMPTDCSRATHFRNPTNHINILLKKSINNLFFCFFFAKA